MTSDYALTFVVEYITLITAIFIYRFASRQWDLIGFAEYVVTRRAISVLIPIVGMGVDVGLQRFLPTSERDSSRGATYLTTAVLMVAGVLTLVTGFLLGFPALSAFLLFGPGNLTHLVFPVVILVAGGAAFTLAYGCLRGRGSFRRANALKLVAYAALPVASLQIFASSAQEFLTAVGAGWFLCSLLFVVFERPRVLVPEPANWSGSFLRYSAARMPGDVLHLALLSAPTFVVTHAAGLAYGAVTAVGVALVVMIAALFSPIGLVLLSTASRQMTEDAQRSVRSHVRQMMHLAVIAASLLVLAGWAATPFLLESFLEIDLAGAVEDVRLMLLGAIPYSIYVTGRRGLDAARVAPMNTRNLAVAFGLYLAGSAAIAVFHLDYRVALFLFVLSFSVLGALTVVETARARGMEAVHAE